MLLVPIIILICLVIGIACIVYAKQKERELIEQVTPITRGEWSERRVVLKLLKMGINPRAIFHDLYIQKPNGEYTQIDVAVATKTGIIVFEVKDYSGWIFVVNIRNIGLNYWRMVKKSIVFIIPSCKMPDISRLSDNVCHKISAFRFILLSYFSEIVNLRILLVMQTILLLYTLVLFSR